MAHILVAEDSRTQAATFEALLEVAGHEVTIVDNGIAGLEAMRNCSPDVVLTDMEMPEMNGLELVNTLRVQYPSVPVILMTAHGSEDLAVKALAAGAAAYVPKIHLNENLLGTIEQVLGLMRADRSYANLIDCMTRTEFAFVLPNDPMLIEPLVNLVQQMIAGIKICDVIGRVRMGMALEHALVNAMFHGNLEIGREEQAAGVQQVQELLAERAARQPYRDRRIHVDVKLDIDEARFVIRDDGSGFDISTVPGREDAYWLEREGGRGLVLMRSFMDEVAFSDRGNEVTMVKRREAR